jgi:SAM-dependent methyltransferase
VSDSINQVDAHYGQRDLLGVVLDALRNAGLDPTRVAPDDLAALEEFHTLGRQATVELAELAGVNKAMRVLDVGAGLGGPARLLAHHYGCRVTALDLTEEYCRVAQALTEMTGLSDLVEVRQGDALDLPFPDTSFDLVWTQHASMNIADKARLYGEIRRVLVPGGRFALFDIVAGESQPIHFPVPWAADPSISFLVSIDDMHDLMIGAGLSPLIWEDLTEGVLAWFQAQAGKPPTSSPAIGLHLLAPDMGEKLANQVRNISEHRVRFLRAVLRR